jgi:hypothetical protein
MLVSHQEAAQVIRVIRVIREILEVAVQVVLEETDIVETLHIFLPFPPTLIRGHILLDTIVLLTIAALGTLLLGTVLQLPYKGHFGIIKIPLNTFLLLILRDIIMRLSRVDLFRRLQVGLAQVEQVV